MIFLFYRNILNQKKYLFSITHHVSFNFRGMVCIQATGIMLVSYCIYINKLQNRFPR